MLFHYYKDDNTFKLVGAIQAVVGIDLPQLLESYGRHFYTYAYSRGYDRMMKTLGRDFFSFVQNLDLLHSLLALTYKGMRPPQFRCERKNNKLFVHVYTVRPAMYPVAVGTLKEVAKQLFDTEIEMILVERLTGEVFESKFCEHVIFDVKVIGVDRGMGITVSKTRNCSVVLDKGIQPEDLDRYMDKQMVSLPRRSLHLAIPYSVIFNDKMHILGAGLHLKTLCSDLEKANIKFNDVFEIKEPSVTLSFRNIMNCSNTYMYFFLQMKPRKGKNNVEEECPLLRGHMVPLENHKHIAFLGSPFFESIGDLLASTCYLNNIPQDQLTMEIMFMNEQRRADVEMSKKLDETTATMKKLANALEEEKKKTDTLLYEMLPVKVANQLRNGEVVSAEKHDCVTILFSDIVTFTNMAAKCEPIQIVALLNDLFMKFDNLSTEYDVYKVETIGDAYMVVSGVPEFIDDHAQRIATMGLGMVGETKRVISPVSGSPIQIRVGIHTGPVVSGVVGTRMPRYCLFGDTVNTASRMESHGVPGRVHISGSTYQKLVGTEYELEPRGEVEIKGKGLMNTYFINGKSGKAYKPPQTNQVHNTDGTDGNAEDSKDTQVHNTDGTDGTAEDSKDTQVHNTDGTDGTAEDSKDTQVHNTDGTDGNAEDSKDTNDNTFTNIQNKPIPATSSTTNEEGRDKASQSSLCVIL
ncbi:guanylate cyclase soluble subunit beta-2-like [Argopecten irradians]|uniref:guanylate cyclase soluble subunit beta-2-like n=1 Tax=Argopecten irradians TaxID=31199 RepID=UPI003719BC85